MAPQNLLIAFRENVRRLDNKDCLLAKKGNRWEALSWREVEDRVFRIARGLETLGVKKGEVVALFSGTRMEWTLCDLAILSVGAVTVPIYQSNTADQAAYILGHSEARVVVVETREHLQRVQAHRKDLPHLKAIVLISGSPEAREVIALPQLEELGKGDHLAWVKGFESIKQEQIASVVYTSGTTGPPKGAVITHGNIIASLEASRRLLDLSPKDTSLLFLPLAHILSRIMEWLQIYNGFVHAYAEGIDKLVENLGEVRPHFIVSVPRIFEKVYERVISQVEAGSPLKKAIFSWAVAVGREVSARIQKGKGIPPWLLIQREIASALVFGKLKKRLGGRLRFAVSGGAPLSKEIAEFFHAAGILILEGYGLTETTAVTNCNTLKKFRFGTVGAPTYRVEERIAPDGEILVRGPAVFQGYYKNEAATREAITPDGWFKTGDIGELDADGFLKITDRKKDIIVTAAGKNIAPQNIESILKTVSFISQVMVHGDRRKYLSALVTLNREEIERIARTEGIVFGGFADLVRHPKIYERVKGAIEEKNKKLASFETIKRFAILEEDFTQETGELTPTLKVKRKFVSEKYRDVLDRLYEE